MQIQDIIRKQRELFGTGITKSLSFRMNALKKLRKVIINNEQKILDALKKDLNKSEFESYMTEIGMVLDEIKTFLKYTPSWAKDQKVKTPLAQFAGKSYIINEPYGVVLVMSPWNYPFQLSIAPIIGAIAAGNCIIIKPSEFAPNVSRVIADMITENFSFNYITVIQGGLEVNEQLLDQKFDYIFFTGSVNVGKIVMEKASKHLTPVCLELGGKSPCIVDKTADIPLAAKRIAFGKFINAGQTCVAPDYVYVHSQVKDKFIKYLKKYITVFFGNDPLNNPNYPKIINEKHLKRIMNLIEGETVLVGGISNNKCQIAPTILDHIHPYSNIMQEEIFGPVLPIITYDSIKEVTYYINSRPKPLALYLFTTNKKLEKYICNSVSFGGGCINDTIIHLATPYMGFGGVGESGMGSYHGNTSFLTFSHRKSIVKKANWIDLPMRYHPYTKRKDKMVRMFLK
ncbi:MAG: aldehyde dehydrogenase [Anaerocolumna sp.]|jgi:aldehyde dehydrogenase (NAD+)|nr:aldehyde dehydrogenase [Anaerocolumna sp.]